VFFRRRPSRQAARRKYLATRDGDTAFLTTIFSGEGNARKAKKIEKEEISQTKESKSQGSRESCDRGDQRIIEPLRDFWKGGRGKGSRRKVGKAHRNKRGNMEKAEQKNRIVVLIIRKDNQNTDTAFCVIPLRAH
jgi:hypothetical protein